jgi:hypothetical protein
MVSALDGITPSASIVTERRIPSACVDTCLRCGCAGRRQLLPQRGNLGCRSDRLYQRTIRSKKFVPIVAVGVVEQFAQCPYREALSFVHNARGAHVV